MSTQRSHLWTRSALGVACLLFVSAAGLLGSPGTVQAASSVFTDFCTADDYDNANPQTTGLFTDLRRGPQINADYTNCILNFSGSVGSGRLWITLIGTPASTPPSFSSGVFKANVVIRQFNNGKAIGFVGLYDPTTKKGLFLGLFDAGNSDSLTLSIFDGAGGIGTLTKTLASISQGSKIKENVLYELEFAFSTSGGNLSVSASVEPTLGGVEDPPGCCLTFTGSLSALGLSSSGQAGIGAWAKGAFVDSGITDFEFSGF
jgi:hypothetical protein